MKEQVTVGAGGQFASCLAGLTDLLVFPKVDCFVEIFGVVGLSRFVDVSFDCEVESGNQEMYVRECFAPLGIVVPEMFVLLVDPPYFC